MHSLTILDIDGRLTYAFIQHNLHHYESVLGADIVLIHLSAY